MSFEQCHTLSYLPNGKAVCMLHQERICARCCVDYTFDETDSDADEFESDVMEYANSAWEVPAREGSASRFIPQHDSQLQPFTHRGEKPAPLSCLDQKYCSRCQLTWLVGRAGSRAAREHPSHHTTKDHAPGVRKTTRTLLIRIDGACSNNGSGDARAGFGVFVGPNSRYNRAEKCLDSIPTSQKAELAAAAAVLELVSSEIFPARNEDIKERSKVYGRKGTGEERMNEFELRLKQKSDEGKLRLVIATDSSYLVEGVCKNMMNWTQRRDGTTVNKRGDVMKNGAKFWELERAMVALGNVGVEVVWYHIKREENQEADTLANEGMNTTGGGFFRIRG